VTRPALAHTTVDDHLGDGAKRFFSAGYKRVEYTFGPVSALVLDPAAASVGTHVGLGYPADWSKKSAGVDLRPHLSTIDAILFGVQLSELVLVRAFLPTPEQHRAMWVRKVAIRAGQSPEEDLRELGLAARLVSTREEPGSLCGTVSVVDCAVGSMRVRCEVEHSGGEVRPGRDTYGSPDVLLGPAASRYYGTGFTRGGHRIDDLALDLPALRVTAAVELTPAGAEEGVEGAYQPAATMVDAFATGLQLAQVLLYELDSMRRSASNTLWMRSTTLEVAHPVRPVGGPLPLLTELRDPNLIEMGGGVWRTADVVAELGGVRFTCAVAHSLPRGV